jgi:hypothetical protein
MIAAEVDIIVHRMGVNVGKDLADDLRVLVSRLGLEPRTG